MAQSAEQKEIAKPSLEAGLARVRGIRTFDAVMRGTAHGSMLRHIAVLCLVLDESLPRHWRSTPRRMLFTFETALCYLLYTPHEGRPGLRLFGAATASPKTVG